jgi:hypothetical protein
VAAQQTQAHFVDRRFPNFQPNPNQDYGRFLTEEGGILFVYKDFDFNLRHTIWRLASWTFFTGLEAFYLYGFQPLRVPPDRERRIRLIVNIHSSRS